MKARLTLKPGQDGTRKLVEKYGDRLLYVRYRYDANRKRRVKTVELIEEEVPWLPEHGRLSRKTVVGLRVTAHEWTLQRQLRQAGGRWDAHQKVWNLPYEKVVELGLEERIVMLDSAGGHE
ncbi:MAG: hypothetical protein RBT80_25805 [Candidatus Vecturithrix sp.]|nr:hypothetical protein [Candidatus Vecturithrix sp.]